jgi:hypothetical protein
LFEHMVFAPQNHGTKVLHKTKILN